MELLQHKRPIKYTFSYGCNARGERREAIYCGLSGISWKSGQALSVYVATIPMDIWGNSIESPLGVLLVGPIATLFGLVALCIVWFYPVLQDGTRPRDASA